MSAKRTHRVRSSAGMWHQPVAAPKFSALRRVKSARGLNRLGVILRIDKDHPRRWQQLVENEHCISVRGEIGGLRLARRQIKTAYWTHTCRPDSRRISIAAPSGTLPIRLCHCGCDRFIVKGYERRSLIEAALICSRCGSEESGPRRRPRGQRTSPRALSHAMSYSALHSTPLYLRRHES